MRISHLLLAAVAAVALSSPAFAAPRFDRNFLVKEHRAASETKDHQRMERAAKIERVRPDMQLRLKSPSLMKDPCHRQAKCAD